MNQKTANKKYNPNSAITHLQRMGKSLQGAACIDDVSFSYSGNQLIAAQDAGTPASLMGDAFHFVDGDDYYSEYGYDGCGSLTSDSNKGIHMIVYDFNGMPTCVWFDNGSITDYVYTADGVKLKTIHRTAVPGTVPSGSTPSLSEQNTLYKDSTLYIGALEVIPSSYFRSVEGVKGLFEIRVEESGNIYRVFCCFDDGNLVILFNAFQKKTQKTPKGEIEKAKRIMNEYFENKNKK